MTFSRDCAITWLACSIIFVVIAANAAQAAYVPIFGGLEYNTATKVGYQTFASPFPFQRNLVNNSGTAIAIYTKTTGFQSSQSQIPFQWHTDGAPPTQMLPPPNYTSASSRLWSYAINDSGAVAGTAYNDQYGERAVRWDASGVGTELANLGTRNGGTFTWGQGFAINNAGTVVGYSERWAGSLYYDRAARWDAGGTAVTELGELPHGPLRTVPLSRAQAVNESNTAVGWAQKFDAGGIDRGRRAVRWDGTGTAATELGNLGTTAAGYTESQAYDVNESGTAIGIAALNGLAGSKLAVRWDANGTIATQLDSLDGVFVSEAFAINDAGTAVGYRRGTNGKYTALRWDAAGAAATVLENLGALGEGQAFDINNSGVSVGSATKVVDGVTIGGAVAWRGNRVAIDLNNLIDPASGWSLRSAYSISDTNWITGRGYFDPDGQGSLPAYLRNFTLRLPGPMPGDYNADFVVDSADYTYWRDHLGQSIALTGESSAPTTPGLIDDEDYDYWKQNFGASLATNGAAAISATPEPASLLQFAFAASLATRFRPQRVRRHRGFVIETAGS